MGAEIFKELGVLGFTKGATPASSDNNHPLNEGSNPHSLFNFIKGALAQRTQSDTLLVKGLRPYPQVKGGYELSVA